MDDKRLLTEHVQQVKCVLSNLIFRNLQNVHTLSHSLQIRVDWIWIENRKLSQVIIKDFTKYGFQSKNTKNRESIKYFKKYVSLAVYHSRYRCYSTTRRIPNCHRKYKMSRVWQKFWNALHIFYIYIFFLLTGVTFLLSFSLTFPLLFCFANLLLELKNYRIVSALFMRCF